MAKLTAKKRNNMPKKMFGDKAYRKYPMPDKSHAANAKARAKQMLDKGIITQAKYDHIVAMANHILAGK